VTSSDFQTKVSMKLTIVDRPDRKFKAHSLRFVLPILLSIACFAILLGSAPAVEADSSGLVSGTVWFDRNGNGIREPSEPVLMGRPVYLQQVGLERDNEVPRTAYADEDGLYLFDALPYGQYRVYTLGGQEQPVIVGEANGAVSVDISVPGHIVFLPITTR
jgi:hypothetical protein